MRFPFSRRYGDHAVKYWVVLLLFVVPFGVYAQIYQWTDKNGQVHYAQTPPPGQTAGAVDLGESQLGQALLSRPVESPAPAASGPDPTAPAAAPKKRCCPSHLNRYQGGSPMRVTRRAAISHATS
jgi:hypothetical protein